MPEQQYPELAKTEAIVTATRALNELLKEAKGLGLKVHVSIVDTEPPQLSIQILKQLATSDEKPMQGTRTRPAA